MRTTIDLPDDLHRLARQLAHESNRSMGDVVAELMRLGLRRDLTPVSTGPRGLPLVSVGRPITAEDVRALDDDALITYLADGNVLIALTVVDHVHHRSTVEWFERSEPALATCPITQGTLLRFLIREGHTAAAAAAVLDALRSQDWHTFWPDDLPYDAPHLVGVIGHRQVTDAYLVALARHHQGHVVTLDEGLAALHPDAVHLLVP